MYNILDECFDELNFDIKEEIKRYFLEFFGQKYSSQITKTMDNTTIIEATSFELIRNIEEYLDLKADYKKIKLCNKALLDFGINFQPAGLNMHSFLQNAKKEIARGKLSDEVKNFIKALGYDYDTQQGNYERAINRFNYFEKRWEDNYEVEFRHIELVLKQQKTYAKRMYNKWEAADQEILDFKQSFLIDAVGEIGQIIEEDLGISILDELCESAQELKNQKLSLFEMIISKNRQGNSFNFLNIKSALTFQSGRGEFVKSEITRRHLSMVLENLGYKFDTIEDAEKSRIYQTIEKYREQYCIAIKTLLKKRDRYDIFVNNGRRHIEEVYGKNFIENSDALETFNIFSQKKTGACNQIMLKDGHIKNMIMLTMDTNQDHTLIHESIHSISSHLISYNGTSGEAFAGFDRTKSLTPRGEESPYRDLDEYFTEYLAVKISKYLQERGITLRGDDYIDECIYTKQVNLLKDFFDSYEEELIDAKLSQDPQTALFEIFGNEGLNLIEELMFEISDIVGDKEYNIINRYKLQGLTSQQALEKMSSMKNIKNSDKKDFKTLESINDIVNELIEMQKLKEDEQE